MPNIQSININDHHVPEVSAQGVNQPLKNGELPLHFAVRNNQPEVVKTLLANGADPEVKDFQGLSAIDHAVLMGNETLLATILGHKIGKELKDVQAQIKCKGSAAHVNQLQLKIQRIATVDVKDLTPINKAAYQGDFDELSKLVTRSNVNDLDAKGLAPIHYAILGNRVDAVEKLLALGSNVSMLTREGDSLLHFAAISGSSEILKLLSSKIDLNGRNANGETAMHYAAAKEKLALVEILVKAGANPHQLDNKGMSPLALFGTSAYQRDPLSLPKTQVVMFAASALMWVSTMAVAGGFATSNQAQITASLLILGSSVAWNWSEFALFVTSLDTKWKKAMAITSGFGIAAIPPLNVAFHAWKTYHVARSSFEGLKNCWRNVGYRNWAVSRNVVVYSVNTANSAKSLYKTCVATYELFLNVPYLFRIFAAGWNNDEEAFFEAYTEYLRFLKDRYNIGNDSIDLSLCEKVDPSTLVSLNTVERLRKPELNPQCPEHALMMLSPTFTMDELRSQGTALYKKAFRTMMMKEVHPDKAGSSEEIKEAAVRLNAARETLDKWVEKNS